MDPLTTESQMFKGLITSPEKRKSRRKEYRKMMIRTLSRLQNIIKGTIEADWRKF